MENKTGLFLVLALFTILFTATNVYGQTITSKDNEAKQEIFSDLAKSVNDHYSKYKTIIATTHDNQTILIYNQSQAPPPPPPTCLPNEFWNETAQKCIPIPQPPVCPTGQHWNTTTQQCEDNKIPPPPPQPSDRPVVDFNQTKWVRTVSIGDIDNNNGLVTQLNLAKKYHTQILIVTGDYGYNSCTGVISKINAAGFTSANAIIIQGNHDCTSDTKTFNGLSQLYGSKTYASGKVEVFALDGNTGLSCTGTQFTVMKDKIQSSDAWYNIGAIHQPFVTVDSDHGPNGQFNCWDPLFRENGVDPVLQAHNHNYQRFNVNGMLYMVTGTGTHDTGGSMYPIDSNDWNGFPCLKCITGTNGITIIDLQIDNPAVRHLQGWFMSNADTVKDSFSK